MLQDTIFVGLDYASAFVQVCILDGSGEVLANRRYGRNVRGGIESCTGASDLADELVHRAGWSLDLAHPGYVHRMKQSPDKSDYTDARMLADLVRVGYLPRVWLAPQAVRELRRLTRHRQDLVNRRRALKLKASALLRDHRVVSPKGRTWTKRWRAWLQETSLPTQTRWIIDEITEELDYLNTRIQRVESRLAETTEDDPMVQKLLLLHGVGLITACVLRAEIGDPHRFRNGKQLSRFCGLTPRNASSGLRQADAGLIKAGNRYLRSTVIETAHRLTRFDARWKAFSLKLTEHKGKPKCVAVTAVANRWLRCLYHELVAPPAPAPTPVAA
jgi:transposase